ncbi:MAG: Stk1 family PASTA domain-containing Ser/Thr kinase [Longicatena sp.]
MDRMIAERYMIVSSLGEGGMADVYLAIDTILNREVAVKVLRGELGKDPLTLLRFQREANAVSKLNHPNVVEIYDVGEFNGRHYIVMEYVRGRTLKQLISQRGALEQEEAVNIMMQLTSAVQHAHENNIIHRDIKPQNVLVKDDGTIKITDFGIALAHDAVQLTQSDAVLGSAHYLAPETTRGENPTNQVDIYALGIVFYELLTGSVPFHGENPVQIAMKHLREDIPSVINFNPTLPQSIENIIIKATVKNRKQRYQSANEMLKDLHNCLLPAYAHVPKLTFIEDNPSPTMVMEQPSVKSHKEKVVPIKEEVKDKKISKLLIAGISIICIGLVAAILYLSGIFHYEKDIVVPKIATSQTQSEGMQTLVSAGFKKDNIKIKQELSDDITKGNVISVSPKSGTEAKESAEITLTISKGLYFVVPDYTTMKVEDVQADLDNKNPRIELVIEKKQMAGVYPGHVISQSGLKVGEKIDPTQDYKLNVVVSDYMQFKIEGIVGTKVEDAAKKIKDATGIEPIYKPLRIDELSEEEAKKVKEGIVVSVTPSEGTNYTQTGESTITISYY